MREEAQLSRKITGMKKISKTWDLHQSILYSRVPNRQTVANKHTGTKVELHEISAQALISAQGRI